MLKKCGSKCFLGPKSSPKSFPICAKNTCKKSEKGLWAAYVRARQMANTPKRRTRSGRKSKALSKSQYKKIARRAKSKLTTTSTKRK